MLRYENRYYFLATVPEYDRIEIRCSETLSGIADSPAQIIWHKHSEGEMSEHIWAPELHRIDGVWYIYFAAGRQDDVWNIGVYLLSCAADDPMHGPWKEEGRIFTGDSSFSLDATVFSHNQRLYMVWAQKPESAPHVSNLYIAEMKDPKTLACEPILLSEPEHTWEQRLFLVNEGPAFMRRNEKLYISYAASGTDHNYCTGLLYTDSKYDLLDRRSWTKLPEPILSSSEQWKEYGPGHGCFTTATVILDDGTTAEQDVFVYHSRDYRDIQGDPLRDPNRHSRARCVQWNPQEMPQIGSPLKLSCCAANGEHHQESEIR